MEMEARSKVEKGVVKNLFPVVLLLLSSFLCIASVNTLFVADRGQSNVDVFHVDPNQSIHYLKTLDFDNDVYGGGPLNLAFDPLRQIVFVSFETMTQFDQPEGIYDIALIDFSTLTHIQGKDVVFEEGTDIGGLCYDPLRQRLYTTRRSTNQLYIFKWHPSTLTLEYEKTVFLSNIDYACEIRIDGDMAYVSEFRYRWPQLYYDHIKQYDISQDWTYVQTIPNGKDIVGMTYDTQRQIFYGGAYDFSGTYRHIVKHSMDPNAIIIKDTDPNIGCMIDGDVDSTTGYLYLTAYKTDGGQHSTVEIWDTSGWTSDPNQLIVPLASYKNTSILGGAAGIQFIPYDPSQDELLITKDDGRDPNEPNDWVQPGDIITYTIVVDPNYTSQTVQVIDYLAAGVTYMNASADAGENFVFDPNDLFDPNFVWPEPAATGSYDDNTRAYTWDLGTISAPVTLTLTAQVNTRAEPGGILRNVATARSDLYLAQAVCDTRVKCWRQVVYVDILADDGGNGTSWTLAYNDIQDATAHINNTGCGNEIWVAGGEYHPFRLYQRRYFRQHPAKRNGCHDGR